MKDHWAERFNDWFERGFERYGLVAISAFGVFVIIALAWIVSHPKTSRAVYWDREGCYVTRTVGIPGKGGHVEKLYLDVNVCNAISER